MAWRADQRAFVITLTRAGEDDKSFRLTDIDSTFASFAGADYDLQVRSAGGQLWYSLTKMQHQNSSRLLLCRVAWPSLQRPRQLCTPLFGAWCSHACVVAQFSHCPPSMHALPCMWTCQHAHTNHTCFMV